jgi:hypothetical protein
MMIEQEEDEIGEDGEEKRRGLIFRRETNDMVQDPSFLTSTWIRLVEKKRGEETRQSPS